MYGFPPPPLPPSPPAVSSFIGTICLVSLRSIATVCALAAIGLVLARNGWLPKDAKKFLSRLSMNITIPALLFSQAVTAVEFDLLAFAWPMLFLPFVYVPLGAALGWIVMRLTCPAERQRPAVLAACAFGNSTGLPIVLLTIIGRELIDEEKRDAYGSAVDPISYLALYLVFYPVLQWAAGGALLGLSGNQAAQPAPAAPAPAPHPTDHSAAAPSELDGYASLEDGLPRAAAPSFWRGLPGRVVETVTPLARQMCVPPVVGAVTGCLVGLLPQRRAMMANPGSFLYWFQKVTKQIGDAAVPVNLILLGASLSKGPASVRAASNGRTLAAIVVAKLLVMPLCAVLFCLAVNSAGVLTPPAHKEYETAFWLVALVVSATPTANNVLVIVEVAGGDSEAMSAMIAGQYLCAPVLLTLTVTLFLGIVRAGVL